MAPSSNQHKELPSSSKRYRSNVKSEIASSSKKHKELDSSSRNHKELPSTTKQDKELGSPSKKPPRQSVSSNKKPRESASTIQKLKDFFQMVHRLIEYSGLSNQIVQNIVIFAKSLTVKGSDVIEGVVFRAVLFKTFNMVDIVMMDRLYHVICKHSQQRLLQDRVTIEDFSYLICTFLTDNLDLKINFVFRIYDLNEDGVLDDVKDLHKLFHPTAIKMAAEDDEVKDVISDLTNYFLRIFGKDKERVIELEDFRKRVKEDIILLQPIGRCLPYQRDSNSFKEKLQALDPEYATNFFSGERDKVLLCPDIPKKTFYPVVMDCPDEAYAAPSKKSVSVLSTRVQ